jgi:HEXXH motif-containing protein
MALLESAQHSQRRLALRALLDRLRANPAVLGKSTDPEEAWRILAEAEHRDPAAVEDLLLYPTVGVWLTRALHHTRPSRTTTWPEIDYLHLIAAAAAVRCGYPCTIRVPVWHGVVSLPTVGHARIPGAFPVGSVTVVAGPDAHIQVNRAVTIPLDGTAFTPAGQQVRTSRGCTLRTWLEDTDPYHGLSEPRPPIELTESEFAEWDKLLDEAWDILTLSHPESARELAAGLRMVGPIEPDADTVGASASAAFGAIRLSANGSAPDFAEALVHEMQHSKLNALLALVKLTEDGAGHYLAPWRDDPRPLVGMVHGVYAFTCGIEFWLRHEETTQDAEARHIAFNIAHRRVQVRRALDTLMTCGRLTRPGQVLVATVSDRLAACERVPIAATVTHTVEMMTDDHRALWRLRWARPAPETVAALTTAWLAGAPASVPAGSHIVADEPVRRLPANRRMLLRTKATEPELFAAMVARPATLPGTTPRADAALCTGDHAGAAAAYTDRLHTDPEDAQAWVGLGLALHAQGRNATALLEHPELTVAVHRHARTLGGRSPEPAALAAWLGAAD